MKFCKHRVMDRCDKDDRPCIFSMECYEPEEAKRQTNADRIRAMSDDELIGCLLELQDIAIKRFANFELPNYQWMADWLQQPAEEHHER